MSFTKLVGIVLGLEHPESIEDYDFSPAAPWAHDAPAWLLFGAVGLTALALVFYARFQPGRRVGPRILLAASRALLLTPLLRRRLVLTR